MPLPRNRKRLSVRDTRQESSSVRMVEGIDSGAKADLCAVAVIFRSSQARRTKTQHDSGKIFGIPECIGYRVAYLAIDAAIRGCGIQSFCNEHGIGELTNGRWRVVNQACMVGTRKAKTELNAKFCQ